MTGSPPRRPVKAQKPRKRPERGGRPNAERSSGPQIKGRGDKHGPSIPRAGVRQRSAAFQERAINADGEEIVRLFGIHAVEAALRNPARVISRLIASQNAALRLEGPITERALNVETTTPKALDKLLGADTVHQGVLLETVALGEPSLDDLIERAQSSGPILAIDQITDPHNVGAILRSAAVFGAAGVVMTRRHSPALSGVLAKSASGALEHVPVHVVGNLAQALAEISDKGGQVIGLDGQSDRQIQDVDFSGVCTLVLGAEGKGLRQLTRERCSTLARIEAVGALSSLNVSNAAAVSLFVASTHRRV